MTTPALGSSVIDSAVERWRDELFDLGGRNTLIYYKDLKLGTLDLAPAEPRVLSRLLGGAETSLRELFPDDADAIRRGKAIQKKVREFAEERGIPVGYLAVGMATWKNETRIPAAPVLLRPVSFPPVPYRSDDLRLLLGEDIEINPALLHVLGTEFGLEAQPEAFAASIAMGDTDRIFALLERMASGVPGFAIAHRQVIGTFGYAKLPMVKDLESAGDLLATSEITAALAGDPRAQRAIRADGGSGVPPVDRVPAADEFLILDADSSQSHAINSVVSGAHLVIDGPPGTGKSQTIANLIATLMARGKRVLFVAEKRAAIEAVLHRLEAVGLGDLTMDVHDGTTDRRRIAGELAKTLEEARNAPPVDAAPLHRDLERLRSTLNAHSRLLHTPQPPWGVSAFEAQAALLRLAAMPASTRFGQSVIKGLAGDVLTSVREDLREYASLGGFAPDEQGLWREAALGTVEEVRATLDGIHMLRTDLVPAAERALDAVLAESGLRDPELLPEWRGLVALLEAVAGTLKSMRPAVFEADLDPLIAATASHAWRRERRVGQKFSTRWRLRSQARTLAITKIPTAELHRVLGDAAEQAGLWRSASEDGGSPRDLETLPAASAAFQRLLSGLESVASVIRAKDLGALSLAELSDALAKLAADETTAYLLPRLNALERGLAGHGLSEFLGELRAGGAGDPVACFDFAWHSAILTEIGIADPAYHSFRGENIDRTVKDFQDRDQTHLSGNPHRIRRATAERLFAVLDSDPDQQTLVLKQARLKRGHMPVRELLHKAQETLLAVKPVWAMSPLVVSQTLPARRLFDVVIFDEASQIPVADAIPSIIRGKQIVVAGDPRQLPPTTFFASAAENEPDGEDDLSFVSGFASILDALQPLLRKRSLTWHYRSKNERLIAFSNAWIYDRSLTTFPGATEDGAVRHVLVDGGTEPGTQKSATAEVREVVSLVLDHATNRPEESLGVITMGIEHRDRIERALDEARSDRRDLDDFFSLERGETFFVKNLERVQGDERDAIILSLGYGRGTDGRVRHHFGPLNQDGGERRLNVAVTRAKRRMTLVSSFGSLDLDPNRLNAAGARLLRSYLEFAESGGSDLGAALAENPRLNPFEIDVRDRLIRAGIPLTSQYGVAGYRIDFVASHPERPGQMVLAIEADGASYHSSESARDRDRLRQQHLERLGWTFHRIWSTDWFRDPEAEVTKVRVAYDRAVEAAGQPRRRAPEPPSPAAPSVSRPVRSAPRPSVAKGQPITAYDEPTLVRLIRWIASDGLLRTDDDLLREAMTELGFKYRGKNIVAVLTDAITRAKRKR